VLALPTLRPLRVADYKSPAFVHRIQQVIRQRDIELVYGELIKVAPALKAVQAQENISFLWERWPAEGGQAYADAVLQVLDDQQLARGLGSAGQSYVELNHCCQVK
jgi:hypothetical protein